LYHISVWDIAKIDANGIWNSANRMKANTKKAVLFLKKGTKKLLIVQVAPVESAALTKTTKVFCFFFSKKKYFLASLVCKSLRKLVLQLSTYGRCR
jgi:hypothetical protein